MTKTTLRNFLWAACTAWVPLVAIATLAVAIPPHTRGLAYFPQLRHALLAPVAALAALGATWLHERFGQRILRPALGASSLLALALLALLGPSGLVRAAAPAVLAGALTLAILVPRLATRPRRPLGIAATAVFGALMVAGVFAGLASERNAPRGLAFEIPRALYDVEHRFAELPGGARVHYVDEGRGPTLLFLHGNPSWSFQWRTLIAGLRGSFRCVALDYPGFGLSSAPAGYGFTAREQSAVVEALVDRLGLRDVTLVMQDWGGPIGLGLAGRRPELVRRVVLGNTWAWPTATREPRGLFSKIAGGPLGEFVQMNFNGFARAALGQGVVNPLAPEVAELYLRPFRPLDRRGVAAFYPGQITAASSYLSEVEAGLARLADRPALIFWGTRDPGFPRPDLERFERAFPTHQTIELPDASHFFFEDAAPLMVQEMKRFAAAPLITGAN